MENVSGVGTDVWDSKVYRELQVAAEKLLYHSEVKIEFDAAALVHEAWLRIQSQQNHHFANPSHFKAVASCMMHRVMIDCLRRRKTEKAALLLRGINTEGTAHRTTLMALNESLRRLHAIDGTQYEIVCRRVLGGMTMNEIAATMERPLRTIEREWSIAKAWLLKQLVGRETTG